MCQTALARRIVPEIPLGGRAVGWPAQEVAALNAARIAGKPDAEIRELVAKSGIQVARARIF